MLFELELPRKGEEPRTLDLHAALHAAELLEDRSPRSSFGASEAVPEPKWFYIWRRAVRLLSVSGRLA